MRRLGVSLFAQGFLGMSTKSSAITTRHRALQASRERCDESPDKIEALQKLYKSSNASFVVILWPIRDSL